jgi:methylated-DNA-[protein]-cysteine S-methyltransferase
VLKLKKVLSLRGKTNEMETVCYVSPIGCIEIQSVNAEIVALHFCEAQQATEGKSEALKKCLLQLDEYFAGKRKDFDLPLHPTGTSFQQKVWDALREIPYGKTVSYADIALKTGNPKSMRAVGAACGKNPLWLVVPCHRVIGANGSLTGYAGGIERKQWLLAHEAKNSPYTLK